MYQYNIQLCGKVFYRISEEDKLALCKKIFEGNFQVSLVLI